MRTYETEKNHLSWCIYVSKSSGALFSKNTQKNSNINHIPVSLWWGLSGQSCTALMISSLVLFKVANLVLIMLNFSTTSVTKISYPSLTTRTSHPTSTTRTSHTILSTRASHPTLKTRTSHSIFILIFFLVKGHAVQIFPLCCFLQILTINPDKSHNQEATTAWFLGSLGYFSAKFN